MLSASIGSSVFTSIYGVLNLESLIAQNDKIVRSCEYLALELDKLILTTKPIDDEGNQFNDTKDEPNHQSNSGPDTDSSSGVDNQIAINCSQIKKISPIIYTLMSPKKTKSKALVPIANPEKKKHEKWDVPDHGLGTRTCTGSREPRDIIDFPRPFRWGILGAVSCGKSTLVLNYMVNAHKYDNIFLMHPQNLQSKHCTRR